MRAALGRFWAARTARERWMLAAAALLLIVFTFYAGVWGPMARERTQLLAELPRLRAEHHAMRDLAQELSRLRAAAKPATPDLAATLRESARQRFGQASPEVSAGPGGAVQLRFPRVHAGQWLDWIGALHAERGIRVETATLEATGEPGIVRVSAQLSGGGWRQD